jgi:hypothetical protein
MKSNRFNMVGPFISDAFSNVMILFNYMEMQEINRIRDQFGPAWHLVEQRNLQTIFQEIEGLTDADLDSYLRRSFPKADGAEYKALRHALKILGRELPPTIGIV